LRREAKKSRPDIGRLDIFVRDSASEWQPHEAVIHIVCVKIESRDRPLPIVSHGLSALAGARARARSIEGGYLTVGSAQEAVHHFGGVVVLTHDRSLCVVSFGNLALAGARSPDAITRSDDASVAIDPKAVRQVFRVTVVSPARP